MWPGHTSVRYKIRFEGTVTILFWHCLEYYSHMCHIFIGASSSTTVFSTVTSSVTIAQTMKITRKCMSMDSSVQSL
jgi:hypothetical protein